MRSIRFIASALLLLSTAVPVQAKLRRGPTSAKTHAQKLSASSKSKKTKDKPGPRAITDDRATEIQTALVKAGYLPSVTGHWDAASQSAMQKLQGDNGWQTKLIPDSRALIKLGLGPGNAAASGLPATSPTTSPASAITSATVTPHVDATPAR